MPSHLLSRWLPRIALVVMLGGLIVRPAQATIAEQRARLPPAAECESEIEGRWRSLSWSADASWYQFTLEIHHVAGSDSELTGMIYVDTWLGGPERSEPGACDGVSRRFLATMTAQGSYTDGSVAFGGTSFELGEVVCGTFIGGYNLDQFTGKIDKQLQEFQSVNNDGGKAVNEPAVFRRIACFDPEPKANVAVEPPPFFPVRRASGCSAAP